jgi:hypothetical protein
MLLPERLEGAVYGHLVGDAMGVPYEFQPPERIGVVQWRGHGTYDQPPGTCSDDGALMLALLDSLTAADTADQHSGAAGERGAHVAGARSSISAPRPRPRGVAFRTPPELAARSTPRNAPGASSVPRCSGRSTTRNGITGPRRA